MVDPEDFVAWLVTQPNARGSLYLKRVARAYANYLRKSPLKLDLALTMKERNVFACETIDEFETLKSAFLAAPNYRTINNFGHQTFSAGMKCFARFLESRTASGDDKNKAEEVEKTMEGIADKLLEDDVAIESSTIQFVDFTTPELYTKTHPVQCIIDGVCFVSDKWAAMYADICEYLLSVQASRLALFMVKTKDGSKRPFLMEKPLAGLACARLSNGKYICTNYSAAGIVKLIGKILDLCHIDKEKVTLTCETTAVFSFELNDDECEAINLVLSEKFANGFAYSSKIQIGRLKKFVFELLGKGLALSDDEIKACVKRLGTEFDGKIYVVSSSVKEQIKQLADEYFAQGSTAIFYEAFFEKNESWLMESSVVSENMLAVVLRQIYPQLGLNDIFFGSASDSVTVVITDEILRIWDCGGIMTYAQIAAQLPYIPYWRIKQTIGSNNDFIVNRRETSASEGECIHISKIEITSENIKEIQERVKSECLARRYISLSDIETDGLIQCSCDLSTMAVHAAIYQVCLGGNNGDYERRGKIITRSGDGIDVSYIMKEYCRKHDKITLDELIDFEIELTGQKHRWIPMQAGFETLVRIDEQNFIADKYLNFDVEATDSAIELFFSGGEYIPLQFVVSFGLFPNCGQAWNLFLLESYTRRFSGAFRFETRSVNSKNVGAIVRKNSLLSYDDIMADFVARSQTLLDEQSVLDYLLENGLISQRRSSDIDGLIRKIKTAKGRN